MYLGARAVFFLRGGEGEEEGEGGVRNFAFLGVGQREDF